VFHPKNKYINRNNQMTIDSKCLLVSTFSLLLIASHACANPTHEKSNSLERLKISNSMDSNNILPIQDNLPYDSSKLKAELNTTERRQASSINANPDRVPSGWALTTLQLMSKRYNCNTANINNLSGSNDSMTRDEFAADLNTCVQQVMKIKNSRMANLVPKKDLLNLQKLEKEFAIELTKLTTPVATLQAGTESTTKQELYPTTKFGGEVIFANSFGFGGGPKNTPNTNLTFTHLTRLGLETSFTGKDTLRTYLTTGNSAPGGYANPASFDTNMARLSSQASLDNKIRLDLLEYRIPAFNEKTVISVVPVGFQLSSVLAPNSGYFDTGRGAISSFAEVNPIFKIGGGSSDNTAGAGIDWAIDDKSRLQIAYGAGNTSKTSEVITASNRSMLGVNLLTSPAQNIVTGITYVNAYTSDGRLGTFTGSINADSSGRFSGGEVPLEGGSAFGITGGRFAKIGDLAARTQAIGGNLQWQINPKLTFGAWGGWTFTNYLQSFPNYVSGATGRTIIGEKPYANTQTYLFSLGLSEPFGREGDLFAVLIGMPPKLTAAGPSVEGNSVPFSEISRAGETGVKVTDGVSKSGSNIFGTPDPATSMHYEMFYRFKINDNLFITPGFFVVTNPGNISTNNTIFVGTVRATFRF
jgi:hypothetical protein